MAEKKRSQSLQEQLDRLLAQAPRPYTAEEIKQIEKGRKGQKEIDEGRATIERRNEEVRKTQEQIDRLNEQIGKAIEFERTSAKEDTEGALKDKERQEKESLLGRGVQVASGLPAMKAGIFLGRSMGKAANERADKGQEFKNTVLRKIADDRVAGLTTREGAIAGARRAGVLPSNNPILRAIPRGSSQFGLGAAAAGLGAYDLATTNPNDPWLTVAARTALGGAGVGAGVGLAEQGWERIMNPKVSPDGAALARIESNQLRRGGLNQTGPLDRGPLQTVPDQAALPAPDEGPKGPVPGSKEHLREQAKALGAKVTMRMTKEELAKAIAEKATEAGSKRVRMPKLPKGSGPAAIAGGLAYAMTPSSAEAGPYSTAPANDNIRALTNAGMAGGAAYGVSRGLNMLGQAGRAALGGAGDMMAPVGIDSMTDYSPEDIQQFNEFAIKNLPEWMVPKAAYMGQVPERNPARPTPGMFGDMPEDQELQAAMEAFLAEAQQ